MKTSKSLPKIDQAIFIFDLDRTLFQVNVSYSFGKFLFEKKKISLKQVLGASFLYFCHQFFGLSLSALHRGCIRIIFSKMSIKEVTSCVDSFLYEMWNSLLDPAMEGILRKAQKEKKVIGLFSNSPHFLVKPIADRLGIFHYGSSEYDEKGGVYCCLKRSFEGRDKGMATKKLCEEYGKTFQDVVAFTDSIHDLPLLLEVGKVIAVRPCRRLRSVCLKRGWQIAI